MIPYVLQAPAAACLRFFAMDVLNKGGVVFGAAFDGSLQVLPYRHFYHTGT